MHQERLLLALALVGLLGAALLAACGDDDDAPPAATPAPTEATPTATTEAATEAPTEAPADATTEATPTPTEAATPTATEAATEAPTEAPAEATTEATPAPTEAATPEPTPEPPACDVSRAPWSSFRSSAREEARDRAREPDGTFIGRYTGRVRSQDGIQVDHIIARNYACEHGGFGWSEDEIRRFINDQDNLAVVASSENTRKGDKGPADYLPAENRCWYAARWETLAGRYGLSLPDRDRERLAATLAEPECEGHVDATVTPVPTPTPTPAPGATYASCEEAEAAGEERVLGSRGAGRGFPAELVPSARDGDGDGVVCEQ